MTDEEKKQAARVCKEPIVGRAAPVGVGGGHRHGGHTAVPDSIYTVSRRAEPDSAGAFRLGI